MLEQKNFFFVITAEDKSSNIPLALIPRIAGKDFSFAEWVDREEMWILYTITAALRVLRTAT
jgi:hypothetical protein